MQGTVICLFHDTSAGYRMLESQGVVRVKPTLATLALNLDQVLQQK